MPFAYYERLSPEHQAIYRASDAVTSLPLPGGRRLGFTVAAIEEALARDDRRAVERASTRLAAGICAAYDIRAPRVEVLDVRPSFTHGELHGLDTVRPGHRASIQVWMRTARHARVVAFRTYVRTLLHEIGHHLDLRLLRLPQSFHTEGFFKRESSLFHQLVVRPQASREERR